MDGRVAKRIGFGNEPALTVEGVGAGEAIWVGHADGTVVGESVFELDDLIRSIGDPGLSPIFVVLEGDVGVAARVHDRVEQAVGVQVV